MSSNTSPVSFPPRLLALDGLRGLAALSVMLYHYLARYGTFDGLQHQTEFPYTFEWGWLGVNLFFVISGFVIYMSLDNRKAPLDFVVSRAIRLYPTYWAGIILTTVVVSLVGLPFWNYRPWEIAANFTMFQSFALLPSVDGVYWSLAEELKFYLLMLFFRLIGLIQRPLLICGTWLFFVSLYAVGMERLEMDWARRTCEIGYLLLSGSYCFWFISGIAIYGIFRNPSWKSNYAIMVLNSAYFFLPVGVSVYPTPLVAGLILLIFVGTIFLRPAWLQHRILIFLGTLSYPIYILHQNIGYCVIKTCYQANLSGYVGVTAAVVFSLGASWLVYQFIDVPMGDWLRKCYRDWRHRPCQPANQELQ